MSGHPSAADLVIEELREIRNGQYERAGGDLDRLKAVWRAGAARMRERMRAPRGKARSQPVAGRPAR
jgi:hypothetical protein